MTKQEAIQAMQDGKKVRHEYFSDDEFIFMIDDEICDERGFQMRAGNIDFWTDRKGEQWENGWSIVD